MGVRNKVFLSIALLWTSWEHMFEVGDLSSSQQAVEHFQDFRQAKEAGGFYLAIIPARICL